MTSVSGQQRVLIPPRKCQWFIGEHLATGSTSYLQYTRLNTRIDRN